MTDELVDATSWIAETFPTYNWQYPQLRIGAFHDVLISQHGVVARVTHGAGHLARGLREAATARTLDRIDLDIQIPHLLTEPVSDTHRTGYVMTRVAGSHHSPLDWPALQSAYSSLLSALAAAPTELTLPPPRAWCGGDDFPRIVRHGLATSLGPHLDAAIAAVQTMLTLPDPDTTVLVHGDFGHHNVLWQGTDAVSLIDFDNACIGDPAIDIAPLIGAYGARQVAQIASDELLHRGMVHRATLSLQVAAAAELAGRHALREHAISNFIRRHEAGTLHDPEGITP